MRHGFASEPRRYCILAILCDLREWRFHLQLPTEPPPRSHREQRRQSRSFSVFPVPGVICDAIGENRQLRLEGWDVDSASCHNDALELIADNAWQVSPTWRLTTVVKFVGEVGRSDGITPA